MRTPTPPACTPRGPKGCCSIRPFARVLPPELRDLPALARAFPDTQIVLDHCGGVLGLGSYANRREEIFATWKASIREIAKCPNVAVKLGGLAMRLLGYDFHEREMPPFSEE